MKKLLVTLAAFGFATAGLPHAAHAMECCKDGKCACCEKKEGEKPMVAPGGQQH